MPNRLIDETSPYLLQHAHNPVDWYPWGEEALGRAKAEDRPILLSVGYSACHWCHVMERESFEDPRIADLMNAEFVCIKVDREERPDVDSIYMGAVQAMTGRGGWPMTVFLTPEGKPFYGGTYFPPEDRHGIPGFPRVLASIANAYRQERGEVVLATERLLQQMRAMATAGRGVEPLTADVLAEAFAGISKDFDPKYGGIGLQPKFPQPMTYEFLLRYHLRTGDVRALEMVGTTLDRMAMGGIYDQIGGGFHRYSTDTYWLVPHFEKMLYDNALLVRLYLHAYQITRKPLYRRVVEETLDYVLREMTDPAGGFYSAQDADSEGEEGKFFVWRPEEIAEVLGEEDGALVSRYYGVTTVGNFEGRSILNVAPEAADDMERAGIAGERLDALLRRARAGLMEARSRRVPPERDDKVLTSWNGLMLAAFAEAAAVLDRDDYGRVAEKAASFLSESLRSGRQAASHPQGRRVQAAGLSGGLRVPDRRSPRPARGDFPGPLAPGRHRARVLDGRPVLGRRGGPVLRHGHGPRGAGRAAPGHDRQRDSVGQLDGGRRTAEAGRSLGRWRPGAPGHRGAPIDEEPDGAVPDGSRALALRARLLPVDAQGDRGGRRQDGPRIRRTCWPRYTGRSCRTGSWSA